MLSGKIQGDRTLWILAIVLALISIFPVYSASSNLAFTYRNGNTFLMLLSHCVHLAFGLGLMYLVHRIDYPKLGSLSRFLLPLVLLLLLYTLINGVNVSNASRWIKIPFINKTFQTSALAWVVLPLYLSRQLVVGAPEQLQSIRKSFVPLLLPILATTGLILPANFSTAALIFTVSMLLLFIGGYSLKSLGLLIGSGIVGLGLFIAVVMYFPNLNNRVATWKSRIESFTTESGDNYQVNRAKMAIAEGHLFGKGPGKSLQKNFLPQSNSDFIYAVIVEEFGLVLGGLGILALYLLVLIRLLIIATKAPTRFGFLAAAGVGMGILTQAFVNLGVATQLFPVTGQTLPLVSAGGSSIWMTCIAFGIILSVSRGKQNALRAGEDSEAQPTEQEAESEIKTVRYA